MHSTASVTTAWTQVSDGDVSGPVTFLNSGTVVVEVTVSGSAAPDEEFRGVPYGPREGERTVALEELFPGAAGSRLWCRALLGTGSLFVSHA